MTEYSNREKCIYTQFKPYRASDEEVCINEMDKLLQVVEFTEVIGNNLNHNRLFNDLEETIISIFHV